ncbi:hypothetical protein ACOMHN_012034 [Nucella lapillus]
MARYMSLNTGFRIPALGFGTFNLKGDALKSALDYALFLGYRHIDTALSYDNEAAIGEVINDRIRSGKVSRKDMFVTSKVPPAYMAYHSALDSAKMSMDNLRLKYLDLLLIHQPWGMVNRGDGTLKPLDEKGHRQLAIYNLNETWQAFEFLVNKGLVNSIGLSNFTARQIERIWKSASIKPSNIQLECHCYLQQFELENYCSGKNLVLSAYSPVGSPSKPDRGEDEPLLIEDPLVGAIARDCGKTPAQVLINFLLQRKMVVIPKSGHLHHIEENHNVFDWSLSSEHIQALHKLDRNYRFFRFEWATCHPEFSDEPF